MIDPQNIFFHTAEEFRQIMMESSLNPEDDTNEIQSYHQNLGKSCAEILVLFFKYFSCDFDWKSHCLDISQQTEDQARTSFFSAQPIVHPAKVISRIKERYTSMEYLQCLKDHPSLQEHQIGHDKNRDNLIEIVTHNYGKNSMYLIFDPFNHTYNTAKNIERKHKEYPACFETAFENILDHSTLNFDL
jgi:hypothetical protein